jgi:hypothetical protein
MIGGSECPGAEESEAGSSLAVGLRDASWDADTAGHAARCPASFRFALKSRATLQDAGQRNYIHRGDIPNELRTGTFLTSFDTEFIECIHRMLDTKTGAA